MKKNKPLLIFTIISVLVLITSLLGLNKFEESVDAEDGLLKQYKYSEGSTDDCVEVTVEATESWVKLIPNDFIIDEHFKHNKFDKKNENDEGICDGRTVEVTIQNISEFRINKWDIVYEVPCDMYFDKAWNGTVEISQYDGKNVDTIATNELPNIDTSLNVVEFEELYVIPLKKGDKIIYHPADYEYPLVDAYESQENSIKKIGMIFYTEDDSFKMDGFNVRYYVVQSLEEYPLYSALTFAIILSGVFSLAGVIFLYTTVRYDKLHKHDMEIISQAIGTFSKFIDSKDKYTNNHSYRVAGYSKLIAKKLKMNDKECDEIYYIGLLHDTGKIVIEDKILNKPGRLTNAEYEIIKSHTTKGADILKDFTAINNISVGALHHHERYDGKGYPAGLMGEDIPLVARIIAVADAYDAMSSTRCYRAQLDKDKIVEQLIINKGKQFDPELVDILLECIENGEVDSVRRACIES